MKDRAAAYFVLVAAAVALASDAAQKQTASPSVQRAEAVGTERQNGRHARAPNGAEDKNGHLVVCADRVTQRLAALASALPERLRPAVYENPTYRKLLEEEDAIWERYGIPETDRDINNIYRIVQGEDRRRFSSRVRELVEHRAKISLALAALCVSGDPLDARARLERLTQLTGGAINGRAN